MPKSNQKNKGIYLDYASSFEPNPGSIHALGVLARDTLENARKKVAEVMAVRPKEIIFTSGGTESNNLAILGVLFGYRGKKKPHIITTNIEHSSVLETFKLAHERGWAEISIIPVLPSGLVDLKQIKKEIKNNTILVSIMYANNEIGTIEPIRDIAKLVRHFRKNKKMPDGYPLLHTDAVQAVHYLNLKVDELGVDLLTLSGNKTKGGAGVGVLYKKSGIKIEPILGGGGQEMGFRPGTEDVKSISKFAQGLEAGRVNYEQEARRVQKLRDRLWFKLQKIFPGVKLNGDSVNRLPNNLNISILNIQSELLVLELSNRGIYVSERSACNSYLDTVSHVVQAINPPDIKIENLQSLRFSLGKETTTDDVDRTAREMRNIFKKLKKWYY